MEESGYSWMQRGDNEDPKGSPKVGSPKGLFYMKTLAHYTNWKTSWSLSHYKPISYQPFLPNKG